MRLKCSNWAFILCNTENVVEKIAPHFKLFDNFGSDTVSRKVEEIMNKAPVAKMGEYTIEVETAWRSHENEWLSSFLFMMDIK